ncbi:MAG: transcriptional regulator GcvA [Pseudomonadota bacterium]
MRQRHPLNALRAFESAARHMSFVGAAEELHVSAGAISHHIKTLEDYLGVQLFQRLPAGLLLTDQGRLLRADLGVAFGQVDEAVQRLMRDSLRGPLKISVAPVFAVKWLLPRLQSFTEKHPEIDVLTSASMQPVDFHKHGYDVAIRFGATAPDDLASHDLVAESVKPMFSPRLLDGQHPLTEPDALRHHVLLHNDSTRRSNTAPTWRDWLDASGLTDIPSDRGPRFGQPDHAMQAALEGAGVVLGWCSMAADDLAAGRLIAPFEPALPLGYAFRLVYPKAFGTRPKIIAFRQWLLDAFSDLA